VRPIYPAGAKADGIEGIVIIELTLDREGRPIEATAVRGPSPLIGAALDAARQWRYEPTLLNGEPVPVRMSVTVTFSLSGSGGGLRGFTLSGQDLPLVPAYDLTGDWLGDDGRPYRVLTVGPEMFWSSAGTEVAVPSVFHGELRSETTYVGRWAQLGGTDSPRPGIMTIHVTGPDQFEAATGPVEFPVRRWRRLRRPENDRNGIRSIGVPDRF
jgi:TonB family protein